MHRLPLRKKRHTDDGRWVLATPCPGVLQVRKRGPALRYDEVQHVANRLRKSRLDETLSEIVFDLSDVHEIETPWTPVVARLVDLARNARPSFRVTGLHGQPAAIVGLLLGDSSYRLLLRIEDLPPAAPNWRSCPRRRNADRSPVAASRPGPTAP
jgi:hypothetical protein